MKQYAFIRNGKVISIIEGKDDNSRDWAEYYGQKKTMECVAIPENQPVGIGFLYANEEFENPNPPASEQEQLEKWRAAFKVELYKLKIALDQIDDLESVETIISQQSKGVQLAWQNANTVRRDSPTVSGLAQVMQYTPEQLDTIFKNADQIQL